MLDPALVCHAIENRAATGVCRQLRASKLQEEPVNAVVRDGRRNSVDESLSAHFLPWLAAASLWSPRKAPRVGGSQRICAFDGNGKLYCGKRSEQEMLPLDPCSSPNFRPMRLTATETSLDNECFAPLAHKHREARQVGECAMFDLARSVGLSTPS